MKRRARALIAALRKTYPNAHCELRYSTPIELLVATVLSAQCTDQRVNAVTESLFRKYISAADYADAPAGQLEADIRSTGFYRNKAKHLRACCRVLADQFGGRVPDSMNSLTTLAGIGRKTANVILGNAFGKNEGIVVDTHVRRLANRLGLTDQDDPEKIELALMTLVPKDDWTMFAHWLTWHGRRRCTARKPDCGHCELARLCPRIGVGMTVGIAPRPT